MQDVPNSTPGNDAQSNEALPRPLPSNDSHDSYQPTDDEQGGGRLWQQAGQAVISSSSATTTNDTSKPSFRPRVLVEPLMDRMKSRADPNALIPNTTKNPLDESPQSTQPAVLVAADHDDVVSFQKATALAQKRVHVTQLLICGLVGLLLGWLGTLLVGTSCDFAHKTIQVGGNNNYNNNNNYGADFQVRYGLWKYSPVDSVLNGYSYCHSYQTASSSAYGDNSLEGPSSTFIVARMANSLGIILGSFCQGTLWYYLLLFKGNKSPYSLLAKFWKASVYCAIGAGALQLLTLLLLASPVCASSCTLGSAAILAIVTAIAWWVVAFEIHYNRPFGPETERENKTDKASSTQSMNLVEMADLPGASKAYMDRFVGSYEPPTQVT